MSVLDAIPPGVGQALDLVEGFDDALLHGFARLGDAQRAALEALAGAFDGSPLGSVVAEAVAAVSRSEFVARSFLVLASARVALLGAAHDALRAQALAAFGREAPEAGEAAPLSAGRSATALAGAQQWLAELAIAGFKNLEESSVAPFSATLENLQEDAELTGLAALLTGFFGELLGSMPCSKRPELPAFRWGDLWSAAMVRTQQVPGPPTFREAGGTLTPLGLDVQAHDHFVCAVLYGLLEDGDARTVRVPFAGYKVDAIAGAEVWDLFGPQAVPVVEALAGHRVLQIADAELRSDGDLILRKPPTLGAAADPFGRADRLSAMPAPPPLMRHPVHIAEVVRLDADHGLLPATERLPREGELTEAVLAQAPELLGLLRFDRGGWRVQPLCARTKKGFVMAGEDLAAARKKLKNRSLEVLKERSGRLLRKS